MYHVYVLKSTDHLWFYVGMTTDLQRRINDHNKGYNKSTKAKAPFTTLFVEPFQSSAEARKREKYLKSGIGKEFVKNYYNNL